MKIYIAGPITHVDPLTAAEAFERAERLVEGYGHEALNPFKLVDQAEERRYEEYLLDALHVVLLEADAVFMLHDWRQSKGARLEHAYAEIYGLPIYYRACEMPIVKDE